MKLSLNSMFLLVVVMLISKSPRAVEILPPKINHANKAKGVEMTSTQPQRSRPAPPFVAPIEYKGIRYEQDSQSTKFGGDASTGYLVAIEPATNARLWMLKVYAPFSKAPNAPTGGGSVYFGSMVLGANENELIIETEFGTRYLVNLTMRTSTLIFKPDQHPRHQVDEIQDVPEFLPLPVDLGRD